MRACDGCVSIRPRVCESAIVLVKCVCASTPSTESVTHRPRPKSAREFGAFQNKTKKKPHKSSVVAAGKMIGILIGFQLNEAISDKHMCWCMCSVCKLVHVAVVLTNERACLGLQGKAKIIQRTLQENKRDCTTNQNRNIALLVRM